MNGSVAADVSEVDVGVCVDEHLGEVGVLQLAGDMEGGLTAGVRHVHVRFLRDEVTDKLLFAMANSP